MIRLVLVDDHELFREGLRALLECDATLSIVASANDAREALDATAQHPCDVVILDVTLPGCNGTSLVRDLKREDPARKVLMLSMHQHLDVVTEALDNGADGYAIKNQSPAELREAIRTVAAGERYLAPSLRDAVSERNGRGLTTGLLGALSKREREIFGLLVRGYNNNDIAGQLFISIKTVETHRTRIMKKLEVHSMGDLVRLAARHGHLAA
jgi:DNA-binding NarL/FixJ family response regulator